MTIGAGTIIGHDGFDLLALLPGLRSTVTPRRAEAAAIGNDDGGGAGSLGIPDLLDEGASAAVDN